MKAKKAQHPTKAGHRGQQFGVCVEVLDVITAEEIEMIGRHQRRAVRRDAGEDPEESKLTNNA